MSSDGYVYVGQSVDCSATGNPEPNFEMILENVHKPNDTLVIKGRQLLVVDDMAGHSYNLTCIGSNIIDGVIHNLTKGIGFSVMALDDTGEYRNI